MTCLLTAAFSCTSDNRTFNKTILALFQQVFQHIEFSAIEHGLCESLLLEPLVRTFVVYFCSIVYAVPRDEGLSSLGDIIPPPTSHALASQANITGVKIPY